MHVSKVWAVTALLILPVATVSHAASNAAGTPFEKDVRAKCREAVGDKLKPVRVIVDPTGTPTDGLAVVFGKLKDGSGRASYICVYDKAAKTAVIGGELGQDMLRVRGGMKKNAKATKADTTATPLKSDPAVDENDDDLMEDAE